MDANLNLNIAKCEFGQTTVVHLGKVVGHGNVCPIGGRHGEIWCHLFLGMISTFWFFLAWQVTVGVFIRPLLLLLPS